MLGPLEVWDEGRRLKVSGAKRRLLLTILVVDVPHAVPPERLIDALWGDDAAESSGQNLQTYVYQVRKLLGPDLVVTQPGGYALALAPENIDAFRFAALVDGARRESSAVPRRKGLTDALALWRGTPLTEFPDVPALAAEATRLDQLRLAVLEERIDADLELGDHTAVVPELQSLVAQYPLRERFWAQLMIGLYRGDRQAEALRAYSELRQQLAEILGIDPSLALAQLERQILEHDPALSAPAPAVSTEPGRPSARPAVVESSSVHAAFLFSDMEGSTRRWEAEPDVMNAALAGHDRILRAEFEAHGGRVFTTAGDSFAVAFPTARDAIEAALGAQLALTRADWSSVGGVAVRMGIHVGSAYSRDGDYFGPTLNRAARLHAAGYGGQVLLSAAAVASADGDLPPQASLIDLGEHRLRDLGQPERIHQLAHPDLRAEFPPLKAEARAAEESLFVGRSGEVDRLGRRIERLRSNARGGVVMLIGEPGIGKTRIATRVTVAARRDGVQVLWGRCTDGPWARPYGPFADVVTSYVESSGETLDVALRSWAPVLGQLLLREDFPFEAELPSAPTGDRIDAGEQRVRIFAALSGFFASLAESAPLLLVLDDLHWADEATIALLRYVARGTAAHRVLILGTFRDGEVGSSHPLSDVLGTLPRETDYERVRIRGLSTSDVAELARSMLGDDVPSEILTTLADDTGGNPFFIQQVLRQLQTEREGFASAPEYFSVPATVLDVVDHRVARLPVVAQRFLRTAAVFDGDFEFSVVAMVAGLSDDDALDALDSALDSQLLDPSERLDAYRFTHALARQALAAAMNPSRLVRAHRRAAEALLKTARTPLDPTRAGEIAAHFHRSATLPGSARGVEPALIAANHAEATGANGEAVSYLRVALDLLHPDDPSYPDLLGRLGCNLARAATVDDAVETMHRAIDLIAEVHGAERAAAYGLTAAQAIYTGMNGYDISFFEKCVHYCGEHRDETWAALYVMLVEELGASPSGVEARRTPEFLRACEILVETRRLNLSIAVVTACRDRDAVRRVRDWPAAQLWGAGDLRDALVALDAESERMWRDSQVLLWAQSRAFAAMAHTALGELNAARTVLDGVLAIDLPDTVRPLAEERLLVAAYLWASARDDDWDYINRFAGQTADALDAVTRLRTSQGTTEDVESMTAEYMSPLLILGPAKILARLGAKAKAVEHIPAVADSLSESIRTTNRISTFAHGTMVHDFVEVLWYSDHHEYLDEAEWSVRDVLEPDFRSPMCDMRLSLARVRALRGRVDEATQWFDASRVALVETGSRALLPVVDFDEALMHSRLIDSSDIDLARARLADATKEFKAIGMPGWLRRAELLAAHISAPSA